MKLFLKTGSQNYCFKGLKPYQTCACQETGSIWLFDRIDNLFTSRIQSNEQQQLLRFPVPEKGGAARGQNAARYREREDMSMISERMRPLVNNNSAIRRLFGEENSWQPYMEQKIYMISAWEIPMCPCLRRSMSDLQGLWMRNHLLWFTAIWAMQALKDVRETITRSLEERRFWN